MDGPAQDAVLGLCAIRLNGGRVLAMTEPGRPDVATGVALGLADAVLPIDKIAAQLIEVAPAHESDIKAETQESAGDTFAGELRLAG